MQDSSKNKRIALIKVLLYPSEIEIQLAWRLAVSELHGQSPVRSYARHTLDKCFKIVNVSLVIVKVLVACGVAVLLLQLLCAHHGRADGSVPGPVELPQVNLEANQRVISRLHYRYCAHITKVPFEISSKVKNNDKKKKTICAAQYIRKTEKLPMTGEFSL